MEKLFLDYGLKLNDLQKERFNKYADLLIDFNAKFNLTAITEREEIYLKHFLDSALGINNICGQTLIDIGSGGGFPAIPLKIMNDDLKVTMVEATGKKCEFLKTVVSELGLKDVLVVNGRAEDLAKDTKYRESFDVVTARAVARLNTLCEYCMPFVKVGGTFVAFKGDAIEEAKEASSAVKILGGKLEKINEYNLADAKRALVVIRKEKPTDKKYPRGHGKERKNPL